MREYTKTEKKIIDEAFAAVEYFIETNHDWSAAPKWREAFKIEKRQRGATIAKALLVGGWMHGATKNPTAQELSYIANGIVTATIIGARVFGDNSPKVATLVGLCVAAHEAHDATFARGIEKA